MKKNKYPKYIENKPIGEDQFEGKSHERIASSIAEHIKDKYNSLRIIGIEGEWGSGKSNIIELLRNNLKETHHIYIYDTWGHQEDSQRRAFLEELTEELIQEKLLSEKTEYKDLTGKKKKITWKEKVKFLLARKRETNKKTVPELSTGIIISGIVLVLTPIFTLVADILFDENTKWWKKLLVPLSPIILSIIVYLLASRKRKKWLSLSEIFFIYKGKELKNTTYEIFSDLEPSVKEFKEWIKSISLGLTTKELVIVYDNMDRLPPEKVKEIWSSIHTFFAEEQYDKINTIIPFDRNHLQKAFEDKADQTNEFINKTFSIIYRVTPPVLTDWKDFFAKKFKEAFEYTEEDEFPIVLLIFDRIEKRFTPRDIIIFINELVTLKKIWGGEIPLRYIAIFSLKKEEILKDPQKIIISNVYLESAKDLFTEDENLPNYISALTFNIPIKKASQVLLVRDLELTLRGEGETSIEDLSKHPHFLDILEEVIQKGDLILYKMILTLSKLDISKIKGKYVNERIKQIWDYLVDKQCTTQISNLSFEEKYKILLLNSSNRIQQKLLKYLVNQFRGRGSIKGSDYYKCFNNLELFINDKKIKFNIASHLKTRSVTPEIFLDYLNVAKENYKKYKLKTETDKLDEFVSEKLPNKLDRLPTITGLAFVRDDYSFVKTIEKIEEIISNSKLTKENFETILTLYKSVSDDKPLKKIVTIPNLYNLLQNTSDEDAGFYDLVAIRITYGAQYNWNNCGIASHLAYTWKDNTASVLSMTDEYIIKIIAENIEYYSSYGDLLLLAISWNQPLLKAICRDLVVNNYGVQRLDITKSLQKFEEIRTAIDVDVEELLSSFNGWADYAKEEITKENLEEIIPNYSFYEYSTSISLDLTNHINKVAKEYINSLDKETLINNWGDDVSYIYNTLYYLMQSNKIRSLPKNVFSAMKQILIRISESNIPIPEEDSIWQFFVQKSNTKEITPTIKNIRDYFFRENNITSQLFVFFESLFRNFGELDKKPADVTRTILSRIVSNNSCFEIMLSNQEFYASIINNADEDASDFKENVLSRLKSDPDNEELIKFASKIGVKIITEENEDE